MTGLQRSLFFIGLVAELTFREREELFKGFDRDKLEAIVTSPLKEMHELYANNNTATLEVLRSNLREVFPEAVA